ncbi:glycosyltransferase (plasmid) [Singulisphaera sp. Ch08]|uniref:Glycosyltransferase n=1 Tax=Singulisphaera sp. Ch08 TaxID=3120278 RepID=A0AAU7CTP2_9BACT
MNAPVRVLHCSSGNLYGGVETLLATLARQATPGACPEYALCFEGRSSAELREVGANVHQLAPVRLRRPWTIWQARRNLSQLLAKRPFDVVVCHGGWPHWICGPVVRRRGTPLVFWLHDLAGGTHWVERLAAATPPDLALAGSRCAAETIKHIFPGVPREVIYPPVALPAVDRVKARESIRAELATSREAVVIVLASRFDPLKGHRTLIEALGRLQERPGWEAWIAGGAQQAHEHHYLDELQKQAQAAGIAERVRFLGHRSDVPTLLAAADIFCQPNLRPESFGLAFVEAMDAALPVVSTKIGAAEEIVDASCGILVPPNDSATLTASLTTLIEEPETRRRLGSAGPARARDLCDPGAALARLETLLRDVSRDKEARPFVRSIPAEAVPR